MKDSKQGLSSGRMRARGRDTVYWAAMPTSAIGDEILEKVRQYYLFLYQSGRLDLYEKVYSMYYGPAMQGAQVNFTGQTGELVTITINDLRNLTKRLITLVTQNRLAFECRAINTDYKSQAQTILGKGLVDYYLREKKLEVYHNYATELAMMYADSYISVEWNATIGDPYAKDPTNGSMQTQGDIEYNVYSPLNMVKDPVQIDPFHSNWKIKIDWPNKYELATKFPEYYKKIVSLLPSYDLFVDYASNKLWQSRQCLYGNFISDEIPLFVFYHDKCKTLPEGRMVLCLADSTVLVDEALPYSEVPIYRMSAGEWQGTPFGYTNAFDLMPIQEMKDSLHSTICTNQNAFGVQNIYAQRGNGIEVSDLPGGMKLFEGNSETPPSSMQLTSTAPEIFKYIEMLGESEDKISGMNQVAQGNPQRDMSGQAMALLQSMAVQFSLDLQGSYVRMFEDTGTATLDRLKTYATVPRVAAIAGKSNQQYMKEFVGSDIEGINRVIVTQGNSTMNTLAGKVDAADKLLQAGLITTPEQYIMVITTGDVETMYENEQSELMLIRQENELLQQGQVPQVLVTDNVLMHLKEHAVVANSPVARSTPQVMQAYTTHIQSHIANWKGGADPVTQQFLPPMDPDLANMLGIPVPPAPMAPSLPAGAPGQGASPNQAPQKAGAPVSMSAKQSMPQASNAPKMNRPKNPNVPPGTSPQNAPAHQALPAPPTG